jgi:hypothetical protein
MRCGKMFGQYSLLLLGETCEQRRELNEISIHKPSLPSQAKDTARKDWASGLRSSKEHCLGREQSRCEQTTETHRYYHAPS